MSAPARPVPVGFHLCSIAALTFCMVVGIMLAFSVIEASPRALQGLLMLLLCLGLATTECLSKARPVAFRASVALVAGMTAAAAGSVAMDPSLLSVVAVLYIVGMIVALPILGYLHHHFHPHGLGAVRIRAPRP